MTRPGRDARDGRNHVDMRTASARVHLEARLIFTILARPRTTVLVAALIATLQLNAHAASAPTVTTNAAGSIAATSATLAGTVDPNGASAISSFNYGTTTSYGSTLDASPRRVYGSSGPTDVSAAISGLSCGTTYHFRLAATSRAGNANGSDRSFTTSACAQATTPPTATTAAATAIAATGATLNGNAAAGSAAATVAFDWGTTTGYGTSLAATPATFAAGAGGSVSASLAGLTCATTYHYRANASSSAGNGTGTDQSFTTSACTQASTPPTATTSAASAIATTSATLNGVAKAGSTTASLGFDWGASTSYGSQVAPSPATVVANGSANATAALGALACGTTYHYRFWAASSSGNAAGSDQSFTTTACTTPPPTGAYPWPTWTGLVPAVPASTTGITYFVDATAGNDANAGTTVGAAFKSIGKAVSKLAAGDTILIRKGLYREPINVQSRPAGTAAKPITIGSYGDGEVIVDGSTKVGTWTLVSGTVWRSTASFTPIAVVVNDVPLKQVREGQNGSTAPQDGITGVTNGSGKWYVDYVTHTITADFGAVIGNADPNSADIVVPNDNGGQFHVFYGSNAFYTFKGLTIRGSGSNGIWGDHGNNITVEACDIKFNGKSGISFQYGNDNAALYNRVYQNVLLNWPRGNNGFAEAGGGWAGALGWAYGLRPVARGNLVYMNGGEGIITFGSDVGYATGSALFEQNVSYDNWSVNLYFDNQANNTARQNFLFAHPTDPATFLYVGNPYPYNSQDRGTVCLMLADEEWSSGNVNGYANLANTKVYDNVIAGCRIGIRDYAEGTNAQKNHGLKNTVISNNTIIMPATSVANAATRGIFLLDNKTPSGTQRNVNSVIQNNIVVALTSDPVIFSELPGAIGVNLDYNVYWSPAAKPFGAGYNTVTSYDFAGWGTAMGGMERNSKFADPKLVDVTAFRGTGAVWDYSKADLATGSPAINAGTPQAFSPAVNFRGTARSPWNIGAF